MPIVRRLRLRPFVAAAAIGMVVLAALVTWGVNWAVDNAVSADARLRAADWAKYFVTALPDFDRLLADGGLTDQQRSVVSTALVGNVFRFKLYDAKGKTILQSDLEKFNNDEGDGDHLDDEASEVVQLKQPIVSVNDGTRERNMPPVYAEAYIPVLGRSGELRAITEAYVDEAATAAFFRASFGTLALVLGAGFALAFGGPMLAFLIRSKQANQVRHRAEFLASHDSMTSLLNRAKFTELLEASLSSPRNGQVLAMAFFDVDDFKAINDSFGHEAGDEFLKHVARSVAAFCSTHDLVGRFGGDEFVLAIYRADKSAAIADIEAIITAVSEPISARGHRIVGRTSAGVHMLQDPAETVEDALHRADIALYQAKIEGGNSMRLFSEDLEQRMRARRELEQLLELSTREKNFEIHYQPLVAGAALCGFEALLRLRDMSGAYVPPMTFIPVAESMGLIDAIGRFVIEQATLTAATWPPETFVSVNLSVRQFADKFLVSVVQEALIKANLPPHRLELEITESILMENTENVAMQLRGLRALGVSIAMDDFGTGYSSLGYLWQFGFDKLKIDRSFVAALDQDEKKATEILDTIVLLAHKLGMKVTAEGVETERQADILRRLDCDQLQGYLFGRATPATDISAKFIKQLPGVVRAQRSSDAA